MKIKATKVDVKAKREHLALPQQQLQQLHQIVDEVAKQQRPPKRLASRDRCIKEPGITALFAGASGTGKTMAAEVIANELNLALYLIDLSSIASKYIGETEKNLEKVFDAAGKSGAILFFDEADALFGKRTNVKDSHDRYASVEIGYLLRRMEAYPGLAILSSNMKSAVDNALTRRFQFTVDFPFRNID